MTEQPDPAREKAAVAAAADVVADRLGREARVGLILGTGLGGLADEITVTDQIGYRDVPGMPLSTVESHQGRLLAGTLRGVPVVAMQGRFHLYEGYSAREVVRPVRVLAALGVETLVVSNAAGGMNPLFVRGDLMLIEDHVNLQAANPLVGPNEAAWGTRFPDLGDAYDPALRALAVRLALEAGIRLQRGVYVAVEGPVLESPAEYRMLRGAVGADVVGMSTVPETIAARHLGLRCLALSVVTDMCLPDALAPVTLAEMLEAAALAEPHLRRLVADLVAAVGDGA